MKKQPFILIAALTVFAACNNNDSTGTASTDTTSQKTDNTVAKQDTMAATTSTATTTVSTDSATSKFLKKAADGGMAEVAAGNMAMEKGTDAGVKRFATMMVQDHTGANGKVKSLSAERGIVLPPDISEEHRKKAMDTEKKTGKAFDAAYMDMMVKDHKSTIDLFQKAEKDSKDESVKAFITETLPKLQMHLDSALAIQKKIGK